MPKFAELKREFMKAGCYLIKEGSNHERWYSPITDAKFEMSRHNNEEVRKDINKAWFNITPLDYYYTCLDILKHKYNTPLANSICFLG